MFADIMKTNNDVFTANRVTFAIVCAAKFRAERGGGGQRRNSVEVSRLFLPAVTVAAVVVRCSCTLH